MKKIKNFFSHTLTLIVLLALGVGLVLFLGNHPQNDVSTAQSPDLTSPPSTPTPPLETATPIPTTTEASSTPIAGPPQDDTPEPTWTSVIIVSDGPPPTVPPPPPTPTPTPVNPKESAIAAFDVPVGGLAISPDDQTLALVAGLKILPEQGERFVTQIWTVYLPTKQVKKLDVYGVKPIWSPDGQRILFLSRQDEQFEIKVVNKKGSNEETLAAIAEKDFVDYYWETSDQVDIIKPAGIYRTDLRQKSAKQVMNLMALAKTQDNAKPQVAGHPSKGVVMGDGHNLSIIRQDGKSITIADAKERSIGKFKLSIDEQKLAYIVNEGTSDELWSNDLAGKSPKMLYRIDQGHIHDLAWAPNGQAVVIGWRETGTSLGANLTLLWVNVNNGQVIPLQVDGVDQGFVFSHKGDRLFYSRTSYANPSDEGKTAFYQLEIKP